jgi:hypothetical protein
MRLDLSTLLWQRRVALLNVPSGYVRIVLTAEDLSNFMVHPLMSNAASKAVQVMQQQLCKVWREYATLRLLCRRSLSYSSRIL